MESVSALKVGCGKFFHGKGMISLLASEITRLGGKALLVGGPSSIDRVMEKAQDNMDRAGVSYLTRKHTDQCTVEWARTYAMLALDQNCTVLVGVGGGKCIDTVKCASYFCDLPIITLPTSIATCVATSMVAIMYNEKGQRAPAVKLKKEIDVCIADEDLIATAPPRTLAAGILDSMAKMPESHHLKQVSSYRDCALVEYIQILNSQCIFDFLMGEGRDLYQNGGNAKRFTDVILTNLLHTSIVSGFADGSGQLAIAHAIYDFMRNYNTQESAPYLHGEIVAVGLLVQMAFNGMQDKKICETRELMAFMNMPLRLKDIGYDCSQEKIDLLAKVVSENSNLSGTEHLDRLRRALDQVC